MEDIKFTLVAICLVVLMSHIAFAEKLYKWVDKNGVNHYTNDPATIPHEYKDLVEESNYKTESGAIIEKVEKSFKNTLSEFVKLLKENREKILIGVPSAAALIVLIYSMRRYLEFKGQRERQRRLRTLELLNIDNMDRTELEDYVGGVLICRGFRVEKMGDLINLGVDFIAQKNDLRYAVQIKQQTSPVSRIAISDIERERHRYGCDRAMLITNGYFAQDAMELAESNGCELIDRYTLARWIPEVQKSNDKSS